MNDTREWTEAERATLLDEARLRADPLADETIARIVGDWAPAPPEAQANGQALIAHHAPRWERLVAVNRAMLGWRSNADVANWQPEAGTPPAIAAALRDYLARAHALPAWADAARIRGAERSFFNGGPLSCALLFCASLPECYVAPDLAEVLHATGQLERRTEYRIRSTAAMIFPVMLGGGLTDPQGAGVAQVLKVRLIHATVRNLLLHGEPAQALAASLALRETDSNTAAVLPRIAALAGTQQMHHALFAHGWKLGEDGLPCNQEELAYTLLTFGFVMLRGLRTLGVGLPRDEEEDTLHTWNVMAHLAGIDDRLMPRTMSEVQAWFDLMQARGRAKTLTPDPRAPLGRTLVDCMARVIPWRLLKPMPLLLTRRLCGERTARDIGIAALPAPWTSRALFTLGFALAGAIDAVARSVDRRFGLTRWLTRLIGQRLVTHFLLDQTRPLKLPDPVLAQVRGALSRWSAA
jgi:ER-bound oxygenase mpaB/B'/Rubber oxygenase, catalytic domain